MTEPEIARRCPSCGVSIREAALFCPQCGKAIPPRDPKPQIPVVPALDETLAIDTATVADPEDSLREAARKGSPGDSRKEPQKETQPLTQKEADVKAPTAGVARASMGQAALGAMGAKIQRATTLARDVEGDVMHRARKVREISSVVLDEAGYDPSLRFVLVALVLFVLFLIIVLLNKLIT
jgi:hypothetical protein